MLATPSWTARLRTRVTLAMPSWTASFRTRAMLATGRFRVRVTLATPRMAAKFMVNVGRYVAHLSASDASNQVDSLVPRPYILILLE